MGERDERIRAGVAVVATIALFIVVWWLIREVRAGDDESAETQIAELAAIAAAIGGLAAIVATWMKRD